MLPPLRPAAPPQLSPRPLPRDDRHTYAVLLNGGGSREGNFQSHLQHLKDLVALLAMSLDPGHVTIFSGDGADPAPDLATRAQTPEGYFWLLPKSGLAQSLRPPIVYLDSAIDDFTLRPARKDDLQAWFADQGTRLGAGDTLLFYVTDHGEKNKADPADNTITLWHEKLSVTELRELFALLDPQVRVVMLMSQCFTGAFANAILPPDGDGLPTGNVCGYFASTADRPAYGCYPENYGKDGIGHSHHLFQSLTVLGRLPEAHRRVLVTDQSPDVPHTSTDFFLERLLRLAADAARRDPVAYTDDLLAEAWRNRAGWEPEIRLLDRIGRTFGCFSPRSLKELEEQARSLPEFSKQLKTYGHRWSDALEALKTENWDDFLDTFPEWKTRLDPTATKNVDGREPQVMATEVLADLVPFTQKNEQRYARLLSLKRKADDASAASYRIEVRLGAVLRMRAILTSIAGRVYLARGATPAERDAYERLGTCEDLSLGPEPTVASAALMDMPNPFPTLADDRRLVETVMPAWMGVQYRPVPESQRKEQGLEKGAVTVITVYPDSASAKAGLEVGDIILGPPGAHFVETHALREWIMRSEVGTPVALDIHHEAKPVQVSLRPDPFPLEMPKLPGPPELGSPAPPLKLDWYRGATRLAEGTPRLLFFWATWCLPCKHSLPEVLAFGHDRGIPVIAITDEEPEKLDQFFGAFGQPFPEIVATDPYRTTFQSYGVSGTPTFVLVDAENRVEYYQTGYTERDGIGIAGWKWEHEPQRQAAGNPP